MVAEDNKKKEKKKKLTKEDKQRQVVDLVKDIRKLYKNYEPSDLKIERNKIQIFFEDDVLELNFNEQTKKVGVKYQSVIELEAIETVDIN